MIRFHVSMVIRCPVIQLTRVDSLSSSSSSFHLVLFLLCKLWEEDGAFTNCYLIIHDKYVKMDIGISRYLPTNFHHCRKCSNLKLRSENTGKAVKVCEILKNEPELFLFCCSNFPRRDFIGKHGLFKLCLRFLYLRYR